MALGFFESSKGQTPESVKRRRRIAAELARSVATDRPRSVGQGIGLIGRALASRFIASRADRNEAAGRDKATALAKALFGSPAVPAAQRPGDAPSGVINVSQPGRPSNVGLNAQTLGVLNDPFLSQGSRDVIGALLQQRLAATAPITPFQREGLDFRASESERAQGNANRTFGLAQGRFGLAQAAEARAAGQRETFRDGNGRMRFVDDGSFVAQDFEAAPEDVSAKEEQISRLMESGMSREAAIAIVDQRISTGIDPLTGNVSLRDKSELFDAQTPAGPAVAQAPALAPAPQPDSLFNKADSTGIIPTLQEFSTNVPGQLPGALGEFFTFPEMVKNRQILESSTSSLVRALSINSKFPVGEMKRIRQEVGIAPDAFSSPEGLRSRMRGVDSYLAGVLDDEIEASRDETLPANRRKDALVKIREIKNFRTKLAVPAGNTPAAPQRDPVVKIERIN